MASRTTESEDAVEIGLTPGVQHEPLTAAVQPIEMRRDGCNQGECHKAAVSAGPGTENVPQSHYSSVKLLSFWTNLIFFHFQLP